MSEPTSLREAIARALFEVYDEKNIFDFANEGPHIRGLYLAEADAVLAVLRDLPDDVIGEDAEGGVVERFTHEVEVLRAENHILHRIVEIQAGRLAEQQIEQGGEP